MGIIYKEDSANLSCPFEQVCGQFLIYSEINERKAVPLHAWSGPDGSSKLKFPDFMTTVQDGGKFISLTNQPPLPPGNTHMVLISVGG
jgi:hypothetical protein